MRLCKQASMLWAVKRCKAGQGQSKDCSDETLVMEGAGFEPARGVTAEDLKSSPLDHSGNLPHGQVQKQKFALLI
jgi:hypothetical protein